MRATTLQFQKFINGKRVVFVGPAKTLVGKNQGSFIDSFDVIIRTNGSFPVSQTLHKDYGSRCDVLYTNQLYERKTRMNPQDFRNVSFIVLKTDNHATQYRFKNAKTRTRLATHDFIRVQRDLKFPLLMGTFIVEDIIAAKPKELYLTGMTCYKEGPEYINNYLPKDVSVDELEKTRIKSHNQPAQDRHLKQRWKNGFIKVDETLKEILTS